MRLELPTARREAPSDLEEERLVRSLRRGAAEAFEGAEYPGLSEVRGQDRLPDAGRFDVLAQVFPSADLELGALEEHGE